MPTWIKALSACISVNGKGNRRKKEIGNTTYELSMRAHIEGDDGYCLQKKAKKLL